VIPNWNEYLPEEKVKAFKATYTDFRKRQRDTDFGFMVEVPVSQTPALTVSPEERTKAYEERWKIGGLSMYTTFADLLVSKEANDTMADFVRAKIREKVHNPVVAELLSPRDYPIGIRRLCVGQNYYETFNKENVQLVDIRSAPIMEFTDKGLRTANANYEFDSVIFATGFDAFSGPALRIDIRGKGGMPLKDKWSGGAKTCFGIMTAGFPNMFLSSGPQSTSATFNVFTGTEFFVEWIAGAIDYLKTNAKKSIDPSQAFEDAWAKQTSDIGNMTLFSKYNSWYMGSNVPGKPRQILSYLGGFRLYAQQALASAAKGYEGFTLF